MRSDYGLYGIAIICFLLAAVFAAGMVQGYELTGAPGITVTVVFLLIGIIAAAVGYSARPKAMVPPEPTLAPTPSAPIPVPTTATEEPMEPAVPPPPPPMPVEEVTVSPETTPTELETSPPTIAAPVETSQPTPAEEVTEEKPKRARRRRKKAAT